MSTRIAHKICKSPRHGEMQPKRVHLPRLVDTDCKWGLNRAGRPPDAFWERSPSNPVRKLNTQDSEIRCAHCYFCRRNYRVCNCSSENSQPVHMYRCHLQSCLGTASADSILREDLEHCYCAFGRHSAGFSSVLMQSTLCRLLRVELGVPRQQSLLHDRAGQAPSRQNTAMACDPQNDHTKERVGQYGNTDDRMLKELQEIAAALKDIKAGRTTRSNNAGKAHYCKCLFPVCSVAASRERRAFIYAQTE